MADTAIKLVLFDLGGVVVRLAGGWQNACKIANVPLPQAVNEQNFRNAIAELVLAHETGKLEDDDFLGQVGCVANLTAEQVLAVMHAWVGDTYPGYDDLLTSIEQTEIPTGCLSNTNNIHWNLMLSDPDRFHPLPRFDHHFASQLIGHAKPHPEIFQHVEKRLNIDPAAIAFFDDSQPNIDTATNCGWQARLIDPTGCPATQIRKHLTELNVLTNNHDK